VTQTYIQPEPVFSELFARQPFLFSHTLDTNELFTTKAVEKLAEIWSREEGRSGFFFLDKRFKAWGSEEHRNGLLEAFRNSDLSRMRMKLSFVHQQPEYAKVLDECTREFTQYTGVNLPTVSRACMATLFLTSPNEFTPYHIDSEDSFLLQIQGTKTIYIFDGKDPDIIGEPDIEKYWVRNEIAIREGTKSRGTRFDLKPGIGVHIPSHFPHMVESGPTSSMSLSLGYEPLTFEPDLYRVNYKLRQLGLKPAAPGKHKVIDETKVAVAAGARNVVRTIKGLKNK
jgi:hypothetical protein